MQTSIQLLASGLSNGAVYGVMALSLVVIFLPGGLINFGQGAMAMSGGMVTALVASQTGSLLLGVPAGLASGALLGVLYWIVVIRPLERRKANAVTVMIGTLSAAFLVQAVFVHLLGPDGRFVPSPFGDTTWRLGTITVVPMDMVKIAVGIALVAGYAFLVRRTRWGVAFRATSSDAEAVRLVGVDSQRVRAVSFVVGSTLAAVAGVLSSTGNNVTPFTGLHLLFLGFIAAIVGGLTSTAGALPGGIVVGLIASVTAYLWGGNVAQIATFTALLIVLLVRPTGIFRVRESRV